MKNTIIIVALLVMLISCNNKADKKNIESSTIDNSHEQYFENTKMVTNLDEAPYNKRHISNGSQYKYDTLSSNYISDVKTILQTKNFKFPEEQKFKDKLMQVFNINVYDFKNKVVVLRPAMFTEIAIKDEKFVLIEDPKTEHRIINDDLEFYYNSYVFYGDREAFRWLQIKNKKQLIDLVLLYGYNSDKELVKLVFKNFDFNNSDLFHDLIFTNDIKLKKFVLRKSILDDIEQLIYEGATDGFTDIKKTNGYNSFSNIIQKIRDEPKNYNDPEKYIAFLYEKELRIGIVSHVKSNVINDPNYKSFLKENNYFNFKKLKNYIEKVYVGGTNSEE
ncbi:hypothetical protein HNQ02_002843 [Flavobacterium sp. 7E]|uniref:hypothetical protein n=1 Tax=Flavobacterium sp. 7E TaxID=2735898 RepID=UPI001570EA25|nr:hypothetical protein [Flavobacterium sp. 7E]NRS89909.1 hypothetical protein [Flavobacterium sp. 7E]